MFIKHAQIAPVRVTGLLQAAEAAARAIPPAFPLEATVAVNPLLGQTGEDLAMASARLARVAGVRLTRPRADYAAKMASGAITDDDVAQALIVCALADRPADLAALKRQLDAPSPEVQALPTLAELAAPKTGRDWPAVIQRTIGLWAAGHFDQGQALWTPAPGQSTFAAWRAWASHDLTPELAGLSGFCAHVASAPDTAERAVLRACETLGITEAAAETVFHRLLVDLGGWAQHARWLLWQAEMAGQSDATLTDLLAIRLIWEEAIFANAPHVHKAWEQTVAAHAHPLTPTPDQVIDILLQEAAERAHQRQLGSMLSQAAPRPVSGRATLQAAFCIDVRSEVFRRALEGVDAGIETLGFAGFFGLPVAHRSFGSDVVEAHLPVLLNPGMTTHASGTPACEQSTRIKARTTRALGRFRQAAVSSFAFVEAAGPLYGWKLARDALGIAAKRHDPDHAPQLDVALTPAQKATHAAAVLKAMSLTERHARLVLLVGHGAQVANNPHASSYNCGACGGYTGEVSARLLAGLLNDPETRAGLSVHGIDLAPDTLFVAGLHNTTTDGVTLYPDTAAPDHAAELAQAQRWLDAAGERARAERALRLPGACAATIAGRATNWAEVRPEWGLAGCSAFIAAPRGASCGANLGGRAFLHSYDWQADAGFATLELILTAPVVVASWISLQYYGSAVAPAVFGGGNKLIHNVTGGIGVVEGNGGRLRAGLPWQAVHDGAQLVHDPLRLSVMIEAPQTAITDVIARHNGLQALFDHGWLHLFALESGQIAARYRPGGTWQMA